MNLEYILGLLKEKKITPRQAKVELAKIKNQPHSPAEHAKKETSNSINKIAIIGMSGQFPKAKSIPEFWDNLINGVNCITEIPDSRWPLESYYNKDISVPGRSYSKWMGVLDDYDKFDPLFFNISPLEAEFMDPQQRMFLESCWNCIEDAGLDVSAVSDTNCGVFVGCTMGDYRLLFNNDELNAYSMLGIHTSILSSRISYMLNLKGPSMAVDTACASSLVAIAKACDSLILNNCDQALAGGVCVLSSPSIHIMTSKMAVLSRGGKCYTFDNKADGYIPGEGVGVLLLKRLSDAVRDNDRIYGVISGWGINQDGKTNGIMAPSAKSQTQLEIDVYNRFGINPETISYIEAHGTATKLGDPIEVEALTEAFRHFTKAENYCGLGSVKSNIGHLMTAAGVAGVIKILLSMKNKVLPPSINFETLNEHILLDKSPFFINDSLRSWEVPHGTVRKAAISAFSFSGTNAHMVLEEAPAKKESVIFHSKTPTLFVLSARSEEQLKVYAKKIIDFIENEKNIGIENVCYTLQSGRKEMEYRLAIVTDSIESLIKDLSNYIRNIPSDTIMTGSIKPGDPKVKNMNRNKDARALLSKLVENRKLKQIGELWVKGFTIIWNDLYNARLPKRISLPGYPFLRNRYWVDSQPGNWGAFTSSSSRHHPLLHENRSTFMKQRFCSVFTGEESFFTDHRVHKKKIFPGAAYLEMARAAIEIAAEIEAEKKPCVRLKNIFWTVPVVAEKSPVILQAGLYLSETNDIQFHIYSKDDSDDTVIHCQGEAEIHELPDIELRDVAGLKEKDWDLQLSAGDCYKKFESIGIDYGPEHRGITFLYVDDDKALGKIAIRDSGNNNENLILPPGIIDSAFQTTIGFLDNYESSFVPFSLNSVEIFEPCKGTMWAVTECCVMEKELQFNIDLCNDQGKVCARFMGLTLKALETSPVILPEDNNGKSIENILFQVQQGSLDIAYADHLLNSLIT